MLKTDLPTLIGRAGICQARIGTSIVEINVRVLGAKTAWARIDILVEPIQGAGRAWVASDKVQIVGVENPVRLTKKPKPLKGGLLHALNDR